MGCTRKETNNKVINEAPFRRRQCSYMPRKKVISNLAIPQASLSSDDVFDTRNGIDTIGGLLKNDEN